MPITTKPACPLQQLYRTQAKIAKGKQKRQDGAGLGDSDQKYEKKTTDLREGEAEVAVISNASLFPSHPPACVKDHQTAANRISRRQAAENSVISDKPNIQQSRHTLAKEDPNLAITAANLFKLLLNCQRSDCTNGNPKMKPIKSPCLMLPSMGLQ